MASLRVIHFTIVPLQDARNGGTLCVRNTIRRLIQDPGIEPSVIAAGRPAWGPGTVAFLDDLNVPYEFVPFEEDNVHPGEHSLRAVGTFVAKALFQFHWELQALNQPGVEAALRSRIEDWEADLLLIDNFSTALFARLPREDVRTAIVKLNREADFYEGLLAHDGWLHGSLTGPVSLRRLARFERYVDRTVGKVIVLAQPDLPRHRTRSRPACITPVLDRQQEAWRFTDSRSAFFVGNVQHYPNRFAIEWLAQALAPRLLARREDARIVIVGAREDEVPSDWRRPNVDFRGQADERAVDELFRHADMSLCPIENDFGVKFKAAQAVSYGTPLLASEATLKGLPYLSGIPELPLNDPDAGADVVARLLGDAEALTRQSELQLEQRAAFAATQSDVWSRTLRDVPAP